MTTLCVIALFDEIDQQDTVFALFVFVIVQPHIFCIYVDTIRVHTSICDGSFDLWNYRGHFSKLADQNEQTCQGHVRCQTDWLCRRIQGISLPHISKRHQFLILYGLLLNGQTKVKSICYSSVWSASTTAKAQEKNLSMRLSPRTLTRTGFQIQYQVSTALNVIKLCFFPVWR